MTEKGYKDGLVSYVKNIPSGKKYAISTAQEIGRSYWSSAIMECKFFGMIPDIKNRQFTIIRNNKEDAYKVHETLKKIVANSDKKEWIMLIPDPQPKEGYNEEAKAILKKKGLE